MKSKLVDFVLTVIAAYLFIMGYLYVMQRHLQYVPDKTLLGPPAAFGVPSMNVVTLTAEDGITLTSWFQPPAKDDGKVIVFFHGNAGNIADRAFKAADFTAKGYGFFLLEYRGYGGNAGGPSEDGFYKDARAAIKWLEDKGYAPSSLIYYGESIGTGVAVEMAVEIPPAQVVLEAPFTSAADVARARYFWLPVDFLLKDRFDSIRKITQIKAPVLILHGTDDLVVPFNEGRLLYEAANEPKLFAEFKGGGHSNLYDYGAAGRILDWLDVRVVKTVPDAPDAKQ